MTDLGLHMQMFWPSRNCEARVDQKLYGRVCPVWHRSCGILRDVTWSRENGYGAFLSAAIPGSCLPQWYQQAS